MEDYIRLTDKEQTNWAVHYSKLSESDFQRLGKLVSSACGIRMPESKRVMLESRLRKRLKALGMGTYSDYCEYLFSSDGMKHELLQLLDLVSTNKTDFFREPDHFHYLTSDVLPELLAVHRLRVAGEKPIHDLSFDPESPLY